MNNQTANPEGTQDLAAAIIAQPEPSIRERSMVMCIKQLAWLVRRKEPESTSAKNAMELLRKYDLLGSPLRANVPENLSAGAALDGVGTHCQSDASKNVPTVTVPDEVAGLLEALESMVDVCESSDFDGAPSDAHMDKSRAAISAYRAALAATPAAAPVVLPEPDGFLESHPFGSIYHRGKPSQMQRLCGACPPIYEASTVRALLAQAATATGLPAQAVPLKLIEAINTASGGNEWQGDALVTDLLEPACRAIASLAPQAQADARDVREFWGVIVPCGEGVFFSKEADARWTQTGEGTGSDGFGVPTIGEAFRECYEDAELVLVRVHIAAIAAAKGEQQ